MKKKELVKDCVLYDSACEWSYEDYKDFCEDMGETPVPEDSEEFYEFVRRQQDNDWDDFKGNMQFAEHKDEPCMIVGSLGLWNGRPDIVPVKCDCIMDAIMKCVNNNYSYEVDIVLTDGHIDVNVHHHDGTNNFEIHLLSKKGIERAECAERNWVDYNPKPYWFKKIYGYLF